MLNAHHHDTIIDLKIGAVILAEQVPISLILARHHGDLTLTAVCVKDQYTDSYEEIAKGCSKPLEQAIWSQAEYHLEAQYALIEEEIAEAKQMEAA